MNYTHLTLQEKHFIEKHHNKSNWTLQEIANMLDRNKSTISREIKRNSVDGIYCTKTAKEKYKERAWHKHSMKKLKYQVFTNWFKLLYDRRKCGVETTYLLIKREYIKYKMKWNLPSLRMIYYWIHSRTWILNRKDTLRSRYKKGGKRIGGYMNHVPQKYMLPYWLRPQKVNYREEFGHWEADLVIGLKARGHSNLLTIVERKTRKMVIERVRSRHPREIYLTLKKLIEQYNLPIKTITIDNGFEFNEMGLLGYQKGFKVYKCEPYASHQRGTNERLNGDIRRWYPKGTDFNELTILDICNLESDINEMPRHIFNLKTANEIYEYELEKYYKSIGRSWNIAKRKLLKEKIKRVI